MDIDKAPVAEVVVAPDPLQELLAGQDLACVSGELAKKEELGAGQVDLLAVAAYDARLGEDLEVTELELHETRFIGAGPA